MKRPRRYNERGLGIYLVFILVVVLLPLVSIFLKTSIREVKDSYRVRNMKTSRELASASMADYLRTFSQDYNRNVFDGMFLNRVNPTFAGLGTSIATLQPDSVRKTIYISSRGRYILSRTDKGLNGLIYFRSDLTRFSLYWDVNPVIIDPGASTMANNFCNWIFSGSIWVKQDLAINNACNVQLQNGVLVVPGEFAPGNQTTLGPNLRVFCERYNPGALTTQLGPVDINQYRKDRNPDFGSPAPFSPANPNNNSPFWPDLAIDKMMINPGTRDLSYFRTRNSFKITTANDTTVTLGVGSIDVYDEVAATTQTFAQPASTLTFVTDGANVRLRGIITRPTTIAVLNNGVAGGDVVIDDNLNYSPAPHTASLTGSLALLAQGKITFTATAGTTQDIDGFYFAQGGFVMSTDANLTVHGSLYGVFISADPGFTPATQLSVLPDAALYSFYPPYMPRKPYVASWDYVP